MLASLRHMLRYLILGRNQFILSHAEYKRVLLTGQLCLISFAVAFSYLILDIVLGFSNSWILETLCALLALFSLGLNRTGHYNSARMSLGLSVNLTVFIFASSEPVETGLYVYFITANIGSLAIFGFDERYKGLLFVGLSTILFFISVFYKTTFIPFAPFSEDYLIINVIINYIGATCASVAIVYSLINVNHHSENVLRKNELEIMQKNAELTRLNAELDRFVYSTSHDLRAPLSSMRGLLQLINMTDDPQEIRKYIDFMGVRVDDLDKFIREITDLARNVQQQVSVQPVNIRDLIHDSLETLRFFPESRAVQVSLEVADDLEIMSDRLRLQMIMNNLISNAFKYKDDTKEENYVRIKIEMQENKAVCSVEDNGIGIPDHSINKVFDMYTRAHEHSYGSGLGLYIVKETVGKLNGNLSVKSTEGRGTIFTVEIPNAYTVTPAESQATN